MNSITQTETSVTEFGNRNKNYKSLREIAIIRIIFRPIELFTSLGQIVKREKSISKIA